jgi:hypothetical protein
MIEFNAGHPDAAQYDGDARIGDHGVDQLEELGACRETRCCFPS